MDARKIQAAITLRLITHFRSIRRRQLAFGISVAVLLLVSACMSLQSDLETGVIEHRRRRLFLLWPRVITWRDDPLLFTLDCMGTLAVGGAACLYLAYFARAVFLRARGLPEGLHFAPPR